MVVDLPLDKYRRVLDSDEATLKCTDGLKPLEEIIGQDRALRALKFGIDIKDQGFNVYVSGIPGTGRRTATMDFLKELSKGKPKANDWCYVNNFDNPYEPIAIMLPAGKGNEFAEHFPRCSKAMIMPTGRMPLSNPSSSRKQSCLPNSMPVRRRRVSSFRAAPWV